jgi:hypothetical protein
MNVIQVNTKNITETVEQIQNNPGCSTGFEVVEKQVIEVLTGNVDPQHTGVKYLLGHTDEPSNISASKWVLQRIESVFSDENDLYVLPSKLDLDAVTACVLYIHSDEIKQWDKTTSENWKKLNKLSQLVNEIDKVDCGLGASGVEWNPDHHKQNLLNEITWYQILSNFVSDFTVSPAEKIVKVWNFLQYQDLTIFEPWERKVRMEKLEQDQSIVSTVNGVTFVESSARGATGILYSHAPYGVCFNPNFPVKDGTIPKFTICQWSKGNLYLESILGDLTTLESGWGGNLSAGIIGSPFSGTTLSPETVCEIVSRHVL